MNIYVNLVRLPCGCVAEAGAVWLDKDFAVCPWCGVEYVLDELLNWIVSYAEEGADMMQDQPPPLVEHSGKMLEVIRPVPDGFYVRNYGEKEIFYLDVIEDELTILRN